MKPSGIYHVSMKISNRLKLEMDVFCTLYIGCIFFFNRRQHLKNHPHRYIHGVQHAVGAPQVNSLMPVFGWPGPGPLGSHPDAPQGGEFRDVEIRLATLCHRPEWLHHQPQLSQAFRGIFRRVGRWVPELNKGGGGWTLNPIFLIFFWAKNRHKKQP